MPDRDVLDSDSPDGARALEALRAAVEGTARAFGEDFFPALCQSLCRALDVPHALIGEMTPDGKRAAVRAVCWHGSPGEPFYYDLAGTPCDKVLGAGESAFVPCGVAAAFPDDKALSDLRIEAYVGAPLLDHAGQKIGILVVMSDRTIDPSRAPRALVEIFAARAASELERLRLGAQLMRSQRLEGMGRLAAGVAHDFNNLLTVILSNAEFAYAALPPGSPVRDFISPIHDAGHRATGLTRQLLAFSRRQPTAPEVIALRAEVGGVLRLLERLLGDRVSVEARLEDSWPVRIDPGQLEQVLVNLAVNARDAMPSGGTITIATRDEAGAAARGAEPGVPPGDWVHLSVADEGEGMDDETRARCFEPFFSTKGDRGTGLGLATCHGVVRQAGGQIWVESAQGKGTTIHVLLPRHAGEATPSRRPGTPRPAEAAAPGGTVLVAEDDPTVQEVARRALAQAGYRVLVASTGPDALRIVERDPAAIDALLSDLAMPGLSGPELTAQARALRPDLKVLFVSGFADEETLRGLERAGDPILMKPYAPAELAARVRALLG
ncbi:MAG TPA: ATP-binding protein [Anaeromyxobacteraceae bacterium]|nr:ATP-binding protein [Anaeromyxobacteraceae bacterium]